MASAQLSCDQPPNFVDNTGDCDDNNAAVRPGAEETCDMLDNNCDGVNYLGGRNAASEHGYSLFGAEVGAQIGHAVGAVTGWNGARLALIGAPFADVAATDGGAVYGWTADGPADLASGAWWFRIAAANGQVELGASLATGDVNADGIDDLLVGAPGAGVGGGLYLFFGPIADGADLLTTDADWSYTDAQLNAGAGSAVELADVNADGSADIIWGSPGYDATYSGGGRLSVVYGSPSPANSADVTLDGDSDGEGLGAQLAHAGDLTGDGMADLAVGAPYYGSGAGRLSIVAGASGGWTSGAMNGQATISVVGDSTLDAVGSALAGVGDVDADGRDDLLLGGGRRSASLLSGASLVSGGLSTVISVGFEGPTSSASAKVVGTAGDVDGDGVPDMLIASYDDDEAAKNAGAVTLIYGNRWPNADYFALDAIEGRGAPTDPANPTMPPDSAANANVPEGAKITGAEIGDRLGFAVASADLNGDGYSDLILGAPEAEPNATRNKSGMVQVVFGGPYGTDLSASDATSWYTDSDGDGHAGGTEQLVGCEMHVPYNNGVPTAVSDPSTDCDDTNPAAYEGAPEDVDPADLNCDGSPTDLVTDTDGDGLLDVEEGTVDADRDGIPDYQDPDARGEATPEYNAPEELFTDGAGDMILADVDEDGDLDMLVIYTSVASGAGMFEVWINDGTGFIESQQVVDEDPSASPHSIVTADIDGDDDLDVLVTWSDSVRWYEFTGAWELSQMIGLGLANPCHLVVADFDGDGDLDVAVGDEGGTGTIVWIENDGISFGSEHLVGEAGSPVVQLAATSDGSLYSASGGGVSYHANGGSGVSWSTSSYGGGGGSGGGSGSVILVDDLGGGGGGGGGGVYYGTDDGQIYGPGGSSVGSVAGSVQRIEATDLDDDGDLDFLVSYAGGGLAWVQNANGELLDPVELFDGLPFIGPIRVIVGDLNNDGTTDIIVCDQGAGVVSAYIGDDGPSFADGSSPAQAAASCAHILGALPASVDGFYWINDGSGAQHLHCDMSGGGWTPIFHGDDPAIWGTDSGVPGSGNWSINANFSQDEVRIQQHDVVDSLSPWQTARRVRIQSLSGPQFRYIEDIEIISGGVDISDQAIAWSTGGIPKWVDLVFASPIVVEQVRVQVWQDANGTSSYALQMMAGEDHMGPTSTVHTWNNVYVESKVTWLDSGPSGYLASDPLTSSTNAMVVSGVDASSLHGCVLGSDGLYWNGDLSSSNAGVHLGASAGIAAVSGDIVTSTACNPDTVGYGFGHRFGLDDEQGYGWGGGQLDAIDREFTISVREVAATVCVDTDSDGVCDPVDECPANPDLQCTGCGVDGQGAVVECDEVCGEHDTADSDDCDGVCVVAEAGSVDCDGFCDPAEDVNSPDCQVTGDGSSALNPGASCSAILGMHPASADGQYWLDDGYGVTLVECDMANGGWTVLFHSDDPSNWGVESGVVGVGAWSHDLVVNHDEVRLQQLDEPLTHAFERVKTIRLRWPSSIQFNVVYFRAYSDDVLVTEGGHETVPPPAAYDYSDPQEYSVVIEMEDEIILQRIQTSINMYTYGVYTDVMMDVIDASGTITENVHSWGRNFGGSTGDTWYMSTGFSGADPIPPPVVNEQVVRGISPSELFGCSMGTNGLWWNGTSDAPQNAVHLGVSGNTALTATDNTGDVITGYPCHNDYESWGFGHRGWTDDVQGYGWGGPQLPAEDRVFVISVRDSVAATCADTDADDICDALDACPANPDPACGVMCDASGCEVWSD